MSSGRYRVGFTCGLVLSVFFLWLALRNVDVKSLKEAFASIDYGSVLMCAGALGFGVMLRAVRWRVIAGYDKTEQHSFSRATNLGILSNLLFPGRAGEVVRVVVLTKLCQTSLARPLASALIDRLIDVIVLLVSATVLYLFFPVFKELKEWLFTFFLFAGTVTLGIFIYAKSSGLTNLFVTKLIKRWLRRWPIQLETFMVELRGELLHLVGGWLSAELVFFAILILCMDYAAITALLQAFDLSLSIEAPLLLWVAFAAGAALPSAPSYVGVYQAASVWALSLFVVPAPTAVAIATVLQVVTLAVAIVLAGPGAVSVFKCRNIQ